MEHGEVGVEEVLGFILNVIDTVPQLEGLLLLWHDRERRWSRAELAKRLFISEARVDRELSRLTELKIVQRDAGQHEYWYEGDSAVLDPLMNAVATTYQRDLVGISRLVHSKSSRSDALREFARAFQFRKGEH